MSRDISYKNVDVCGNIVKVATYENWMQRQVRNGKHGKAVTRVAYNEQMEKDIAILRTRFNCKSLSTRDIERAPKVFREKSMKTGEKELYTGKMTYDEYKVTEKPGIKPIGSRPEGKIGLIAMLLVVLFALWYLLFANMRRG